MDRSTMTTVMFVGIVALTTLITYLVPKSNWKRFEPYWAGGMIGINTAVGFSVPNFYNILESSWIRQHPGSFWPIYVCFELLTFLFPACACTAGRLKNRRWGMATCVVIVLYFMIFLLLFRS